MRITKDVTGWGEINYVYEGGLLLQMDYLGTILDFSYDANGTPIGFRVTEDGKADEYYYYGVNSRGDIVSIYNVAGGEVVQYTYDAYGKILSEYSTTGYSTIATANPLRYRGYVYDRETGLYYLQSRYYDPETGRFINADGYCSTGQGFNGNNMFAYCNNNPVIYADPTGTKIFECCPYGDCYYCKIKNYVSSYRTADDAAIAFSEHIYSSSQYIRHEYSTQIYSRTIDGQTTYNYTSPRAGNPHDVTVMLSSPKGTTLVAYAHTHPNSDAFSEPDKNIAKQCHIDAYVVGPSLSLLRFDDTFDLDDKGVKVATIFPIPLTDKRRNNLVNQFSVSWDNHIKDGCAFNCQNKTWPTP